MAAFLAPADYWWSWGDLLIRWLHVIAGIAWIGSSFYFIALDNHLAPPADERDAARGVGGEVWEIHGGGFYRIEKFKVAPETLPDPLYWFKWEAYTTWLSGFALLCVVYYAHASTFLVDKSVADLTASRGDPALDRRARDRLARLRHRSAACSARTSVALAVVVTAFVVLAAWVSSQLFAPRAAYIEVGAMLGTIMVANVFFVIIPMHWKLVRAKEAGEEPDPAWNARGKQRSVHNNYFTLPVVFAMLSNHFTIAYGHTHAWLILIALMALGALVRHYFNLRHRGRRRLVDPGDRRRRASSPSRSRSGRPRADRTRPGRRRASPRSRRSSPTAARRATRCTRPQPGYSAPPVGDRARDRRPDPCRGQPDPDGRRRLARRCRSATSTDMTQAERDTLARWLASR